MASQKHPPGPYPAGSEDRSRRNQNQRREETKGHYGTNRVALRSTLRMVLIGMPGIEKRIARFPQFYSRIGFVHEFRPLDANQVQELLALRWATAGIKLPEGPLSPEVVASLIRMTGGNFRLLTRLLTQIERVLSVNNLHHVSVEVVEAARDSLVIGPS
jgi:DNA transposition AAA+ family ATPase